MGGYRIGSGRSKSGYYKGVYCGSTYELCWVIHAIDHDVLFTRFPGMLEYGGVKYYPDFLLSDGKTIIETKGYENQESVQRKSNVAVALGYSVNVLRKEDLKFAFDYVIARYRTNKFHTLYDDYKPKYSYVCSCCSMSFSVDKKKTTKEFFCSRICAGKFRKKLNGLSEDVNKKISKSLQIRNATFPPKKYKRNFKYIWITDGKTQTRIKSDDNVPIGFIRGRRL